MVGLLKSIYIASGPVENRLSAMPIKRNMIERLRGVSVFDHSDASRRANISAADRREAVEKMVNSWVNFSAVLIAVIDKNWTSEENWTGQKYLGLYDTHNLDRIAIATALKGNTPVIPVLVNGASMPKADKLPNDLGPLTRLDASKLRSSSWEEDMRRLVNRAGRYLGQQEGPQLKGLQLKGLQLKGPQLISESLLTKSGVSPSEAVREPKPTQPDPTQADRELEGPWRRWLSLFRKPDTYDVFISYRREHGAEVARAISYALKGYRKHVFLDVDNLPAGHYDHALLTIVGNTRNFVVILTPHALDHAVEKQDWLRQEIVRAIKTDTTIVPVMMPGFQFPKPDTLPGDIRDLTRYQGVLYQHEYFEAMVEKLVRYLQ